MNLYANFPQKWIYKDSLIKSEYNFDEMQFLTTTIKVPRKFLNKITIICA